MYFKNILFLSFFLCAFSANAMKEYLPPYSVDSCVVDKNLSEKEAVVFVTVNNLPLYQVLNGGKSKPVPLVKTIIYSYGIKNEFADLSKKDDFQFKLKPGKYSFQFFLNDQYEEITTYEIEVKGQTITFISMEFILASQRITVEKPVIYLYPSTPTEIDIQLAPNGKLSFTYPIYENGWKVSADATGEITQNNKKYNYLFWESEQKLSIADIEISEGFVVSKNETVAFIEKQLTQFGLNSKEQADFITYWAPRMMQHSQNFVQFKFNEECNSFAELKITPTPNHVNRIYIQFFDLKSLRFTELRPQSIPKMPRDGFTVVEWGGMEIVNDQFL